MVPNAWCLFGHLNLINTFSMHSMHIPESFIPMKCCWSIGDQNCHSLDYRVEPSSCFYEKVHHFKLKYGSNHLAKYWGKRWIELHRCFIYYQTHLELLMSLLLPVSPWQRCHGPLKWFNPISCVKIRNTSTVHHSHTSMFIGCIAHYILSLKKKEKNLIIVIKKKRTRFAAPSPNLW